MYEAWPCFPFCVTAHLQLQPSQTPLCFSRELLPHLWGHFICSVPCLLPSSASSGHVPRIPSVLAYLPLTLESRGGPLAVLLGSMQLSLPSTALSTWHPCSCTQVRAVSPPALLWAVPTASGIVSHLAGKCSKLFIKSSKRKEHGKWIDFSELVRQDGGWFISSLFPIIKEM